MLRLFFLFYLIFGSATQSVFAQESKDGSFQASCCAGSRSLLKAEVPDDSPVLSFFLWRRQFARPVFCSVILCNSSCRDFEDGCFLDQLKVLPNEKGGCCQSECISQITTSQN